LLTTEANDLVRPIHDRMPVIVVPADFDLWLDPGVTDAGPVLPLLRPFADGAMALYPVDARVNAVRNDDAGCVAPMHLRSPSAGGTR